MSGICRAQKVTQHGKFKGSEVGTLADQLGLSDWKFALRLSQRNPGWIGLVGPVDFNSFQRHPLPRGSPFPIMVSGGTRLRHVSKVSKWNQHHDSSGKFEVMQD